MLLPAADRSNPVRLLLLPISRRTLYVAQSASAFGDIWVVWMLALVGFVPLGLAAGGAPAAAFFALVGGVLLVAVVVALSSLATSLLHLAVRDRRRGELLTLIFILVVPMVAMLPAMLGGERKQRRAGRRKARRRGAAERAGMGGRGRPARVRGLPDRALHRRARGQRRVAIGCLPVGQLAGLAITGALLHGVSMFAFARMLDSPGSTCARRAIPMRAAWAWTLPGLSPGASGVALAHVRLALRTPRGRSILIGPVMMFVIFGFFMSRAMTEVIPFRLLESGLGLASFGCFICLISILPIAMNQFAIDKAGVTMALLSPLTDREYLAGKAVGNALIGGPPALVCVLAAVIMFPGGSPALWLAIPIALTSVLSSRRAGCGDSVGDLPARRRSEQHRQRQQRARAGGPARPDRIRRRGSPVPADRVGRVQLDPAPCAGAGPAARLVRGRRRRQPAAVRARANDLRAAAGESGVDAVVVRESTERDGARGAATFGGLFLRSSVLRRA